MTYLKGALFLVLFLRLSKCPSSSSEDEEEVESLLCIACLRLQIKTIYSICLKAAHIINISPIATQTAPPKPTPIT